VFAVSSHGSLVATWWAAAMLVPFFYTYSMFFTLLLGLPVFLAFRRVGILRWWSVLAAG